MMPILIDSLIYSLIDSFSNTDHHPLYHTPIQSKALFQNKLHYTNLFGGDSVVILAEGNLISEGRLLFL